MAGEIRLNYPGTFGSVREAFQGATDWPCFDGLAAHGYQFRRMEFLVETPQAVGRGEFEAGKIRLRPVAVYGRDEDADTGCEGCAGLIGRLAAVEDVAARLLRACDGPTDLRREAARVLGSAGAGREAFQQGWRGGA